MRNAIHISKWIDGAVRSLVHARPTSPQETTIHEPPTRILGCEGAQSPPPRSKAIAHYKLKANPPAS